MKALGHVFKYGDNVDTDVNHSGKILEFFERKRISKPCDGRYRSGICKKKVKTG